MLLNSSDMRLMNTKKGTLCRVILTDPRHRLFQSNALRDMGTTHLSSKKKRARDAGRGNHVRGLVVRHRKERGSVSEEEPFCS